MLFYPQDTFGWLVLAPGEFVSRHRPEGTVIKLILKLNKKAYTAASNPSRPKVGYGHGLRQAER